MPVFFVVSSLALMLSKKNSLLFQDWARFVAQFDGKSHVNNNRPKKS